MKRFTHSLYAQVLVAVVAGALLGHFNPSLGAAMRPLGEGFIKLVKMLIAADRLHDGGDRNRGVATVAVARWEREIDLTRAKAVLADVSRIEAEEYEAWHLDPKAAVPDPEETKPRRGFEGPSSSSPVMPVSSAR